MNLTFDTDAILSYRRLSYTAWHAIAEFVDNSTQSYFNNQEQLDQIYEIEGDGLRVDIEYHNGLMRITDNSIGMSYEELEHALRIGVPPKVTSGRSKYGMGLKTAACWIGNIWIVTTKKLGETIEHRVEVDVNRVADGNTELQYSKQVAQPADSHYTIIEIYEHNRVFQGRTLARIKQYLSSMYREDFRANQLTLTWRGDILTWIEYDDKLLVARDGAKYKKLFSFVVDGHHVHGWVGVLGEGSRKDAGFSILQSNRVIRGYPDAWRPVMLYGQDQGSNDLINQRLIGEIHLDGFEVSHTKDDILWRGDQEEQVEKALLSVCADYRDVARDYRKGKDDQRGPTEAQTQKAVDAFTKELESAEMIDAITDLVTLPEEVIEEGNKLIISSTESRPTTFSAHISAIFVKGYIEERSPYEPYVSVEATKETVVIIVVNTSHPHWKQLRDSVGVLNYLRHCTYDAIAEWQARQGSSTINPNMIKMYKDKLLRVSLDIELHESQQETIDDV